ncbi:MAG TPA: acylphosphatase [Acidimicrobiia bacterium]|nr:acylphosphatase [Acidimicrobiia bacterium]
MKAIHAWVEGRVQGVTYRQATRTAARSLHLVGWVRNLPDGRVEVFGQGEDWLVDRLVDWLWMGPPGAMVTRVESETVPVDEYLHDFFIRQ